MECLQIYANNLALGKTTPYGKTTWEKHPTDHLPRSTGRGEAGMSAVCASPSFPQAKVSPKLHDQFNTLRVLHEKTQEAITGKAEVLREALET